MDDNVVCMYLMYMKPTNCICCNHGCGPACVYIIFLSLLGGLKNCNHGCKSVFVWIYYFFRFFNCFPDGLPSGIDHKPSGMYLQGILRTADRDYRQEMIPVGKPTGKGHLSWQRGPVGEFLMVSRRELYSGRHLTLSWWFLAVRNNLFSGSGCVGGCLGLCMTLFFFYQYNDT